MSESHQPTSDPHGPAVAILDVRSVHPRDRHQTIFDRLRAMGPGETIRLVNDHDPVPLRYQLDAEYPDFYRWVAVETGPERWSIDLTCRVRTVDARPTIAGGGEPFGAIMEAAAATGDDEILVVYAPFEPVPLEGALGEQGFGYVADQIDETNWRVRFSRQ
ncbi:MAG: DUF2249 domain-containing protein [Acidimicrobiia bacterium]|nr:DUF2249 domain-containing protein [Acidimicrobiia bacterium]